MGIKKTLTMLVTAASLALGSGCKKEDDHSCDITEAQLQAETQNQINQMTLTGTYPLYNWEADNVESVLWSLKQGTPEFNCTFYLIDGGTRDNPNAQVIHKTMFVNRDLMHACYASGRLFARVKHGADYGVSYSRAQYEADMQAIWFSLANTVGGDIEIPNIISYHPDLDALGDYYWKQNLAGWLAHESVHVLNGDTRDILCAQYSGAPIELINLISVENEAEADKRSVDLLDKAFNAGEDTHPIASLFFLENLLTSLALGPQGPTHPPIPNRITLIKTELAARGYPTDLWGSWPTPYTP